MGEFSLWHWGIVALIVILIAAATIAGPWPRHGASYAEAGVHVHTATQYVCASMHTGHIDPQAVIDRRRDRHKAKLPELGLNMVRVHSEAVKAKRRKALFSILTLAVLLWTIFILYDRVPVKSLTDVQAGILSLPALAPELMLAVLLMALIGFVEVIATNMYLKSCIVMLTDGPDHDEQQNVVVFGGFSPFAGYGLDQDGWSFTIDASKPAVPGGPLPQPVQQVELLDHVSRALDANVILGDSYDRLFVSGRRIRGQKIFLHDFKTVPNTAVGASTMMSKIGRLDQDGRHYRVFSAPFANGHLFLTYFFRATLLGNNLFIECRCFLLPPIRPEFTELNELPVKQGFVYLLVEFVRQLVMAPLSWLRGPVFLIEEVVRLTTKVRRSVFGDPEDKLKKRQETYNYGHLTSLRESWSSPLFHTYFQMLDKDLIRKSCEYIIIHAIQSFLEGKGISTEDFEQRSTQIFNAGVMVSGGTINAYQMAVGKGATAQAKVSKEGFSSRQ